MIFKEFGDKNKPVIILLHGGGLSWWSYKPQIESLQKDYFIVTPIIDGHGGDWNNTFISITKSAERIADYIKDNCNGRVHAICGLSLGAQIVTEILSRDPGITDNAVIESALIFPLKIATALTIPMYNLCYGLIKKRWYAKLQAGTLNVPEELFEAYYEDSSRMTKESLINITKSNGDYPIPPTLGKTMARTLILVGEKELPVMKRSAKALHDTINASYLKVVKNAGHGEISLLRTEMYLDLLKRLFSDTLDKE
jgi:pimeloyl-ACP methyl ester carboxylesterase